MGLHRKDVGPVEQVLVGVRIIGPDALDQIVLADERPARRSRGRFRLGRRRVDNGELGQLVQ
jgi:hypothetical protein